MLRTMTRMSLIALLFVSALAPLYSQSAVDGAIGGTVQDQSGASIPKAKITIHSNSTDTEQVMVADDSGYYRAIHLAPGIYTVTVAAASFETFRSTNVIVEVGSLVDPEVKLKLGSATTTVEVTSGPALINTTTPDFANVIDDKVLEDLPVNNYRWSSYALLTPGVVSDSNGFGLLSFRGQSTLLNNVTFDGADDNQAFFSEERGRTRVGYSTAKASIEEFQVNTSNYSVEYGRSAGGVVNAVTRSGTNQIHGEMYFFDRDAEWGAINQYTTHAIQTSTNPVAYASVPFKPKDWRKQYGIGIGGPILHDRLFYFLAFDRFNRNFPITLAPSNPSVFYTLPDVDLPTGSTCATKSLSTVDAANCALASSLYKTAPAKITDAQYSAAQQKYTAGIAGLNSILGLGARTGDQYIFFPKVDWQINEKNHASFEVNRLRWTSPSGIQTGTSAVNYGIASPGNDFVKSTFSIAKFDTVLTPRLSNEVRYQYGRDFEYEFNQTPTSYEQSTLLTPPGYTNPYGIPPNVNISNAFQFGTATFLNRPAYPDERRYQISDTVNLIRGRHSLKFGGDLLHTNDLADNLFAIFGGFSYSGANQLGLAHYFADLYTTNGCGTNFSAECYSNYSQGFGPLGFEFQTKDYSAFAQDEWAFSPRLSFTLGVRYEYEQLPDPQLPNPTVNSFIHGTTSAFPSNKANIGPRIGFAYDVFGNSKTVFRGGYGEFFARVINSTIYNALAQTGNAKGQLSVSLPSSATQTQLTNGTSIGGPSFPEILAPNLQTTGATAVYYFDRNFKLPEIQQADLTLEQNMGWQTSFSLTWLAAYGRRLPDFIDTNLPAASGSISYTVVDPGGLGPIHNGTVITAPFYSRAATSNGRPNPNFGSTTDIFSGVNSNYEGLVAQVNHRTKNGLTFSANYTWSHALDFGENNTTFTNTNSVNDPNNLHGEYGNSNQNVPDRLVAYAVYETPNKFKGLLGRLLNDYEISPSYSAQNGLPYSANLTGSTSGLVGVGTALGSSFNGSGGTNRLPNLDRNFFRENRTQLFDMRLSKRFKVGDRTNVELLGESFNLANHVNETGVNTTGYAYAAGTAATATAPATPNTLTFNSANNAAIFGVRNNANSNFVYSPRQVQLSARIQF